MKTMGYDCVTIPGAVKNTADMNAAPERICGRQFVTATGMAAAAKTICSKFCFCIIRKKKSFKSPSQLNIFQSLALVDILGLNHKKQVIA